jgi:hypothetical protein
METRARIVFSFLALVLAALSFGPSFAHLLEAPPRLEWSPALWREATVFNGQFRYFAIVGAPVELATIVVTTAHAWLLRRERSVFGFAAAGAALFIFSLITWFFWVQQANLVLADWVPGPIPPDFESIRVRWESGHIVIATIKLAALALIVLSVVARLPRRP